jgi:N-methylhydantoinase B
VQGGGPAALNRFSWTTDGTIWETPPLASKIVGVQLPQGGRARLETPGGGGWGEARLRDPAAIAADRKAGYL